jgi:hypothetical protein
MMYIDLETIWDKRVIIHPLMQTLLHDLDHEYGNDHQLRSYMTNHLNECDCMFDDDHFIKH